MIEERKKFTEFLKCEINKKIISIFGTENFSDKLSSTVKEDRSIVTEVDYFISNLVKNELEKVSQFNGITFISEEEEACELNFPCAILDPIDGTQGLATGVGECVVSLAVMKNSDFSGDGSNWAWIYNPFTGFEINSDDIYSNPFHFDDSVLMSFVSRSEWKKGLFDKQKNLGNIIVSPLGSIAFKLGLLSTGACNFIVTKEPKSLWDVAAGTILCANRNIELFQKGKKIKSFQEMRLDGPMVWCRPSLYPKINEHVLN